MIKRQRFLMLILFILSLNFKSAFSQIRYAVGVVAGYNVSYMTYNTLNPVPENKFSKKSYNPAIGLNFMVTQKEILYITTGINFYKVYYGFSDVTKAQILFTDKVRDVPLNFGLRIAKTKKDKTFIYLQGGITFRFHTLSGVFEKYGASNNSSSFGSNFDGDHVAYTSNYKCTSNTSGSKYFATFAPNFGVNVRRNLRTRVKLDYGVSINYQEINNQVTLETKTSAKEYLFAPNSRTTIYGHAGIYIFLNKAN